MINCNRFHAWELPAVAAAAQFAFWRKSCFTGRWVAVRSTDNLEMVAYENHRHDPATNELICAFYRRRAAFGPNITLTPCAI